MPNGIYIQTEYHGKLIRKIVCNGDERWFIGSNCAVTFYVDDRLHGRHRPPVMNEAWPHTAPCRGWVRPF